MTKHPKAINDISELPYYKEEYAAELGEMGIHTPSELLMALRDEVRKQEIIDRLKGVGPKIADHWLEVLGASAIVDESSQISVGEDKESGERSKEDAGAEVSESEGVVEEEAEKVVIEESVEPKMATEVVEKGGYIVKQKPVLDSGMKKLLSLRKEIAERRPSFFRQEWFRYKRLGKKWRKPRGLHSKMRRHYKYRPPVVSIGYRGPKEVRGLHPSGYEEILVYNLSQLEGLDPKKQAIRIGSTVGYKKRMQIESKADQLGIRVLNRTG